MPRSNAPHPYGSRAARRARRREPAPPSLPPTRPRRAGALASRPRRPAADAPHRDGSYGQAILAGLAPEHMQVYGGTVPYWTVRERRAANRDARAARRVSRRRSR